MAKKPKSSKNAQNRSQSKTPASVDRIFPPMRWLSASSELGIGDEEDITRNTTDAAILLREQGAAIGTIRPDKKERSARERRWRLGTSGTSDTSVAGDAEILVVNKAAEKVCKVWASILLSGRDGGRRDLGEYRGFTYYLFLDSQWHTRAPCHRLNEFVQWTIGLPGKGKTPSSAQGGRAWMWAIKRAADWLDSLPPTRDAAQTPASHAEIADAINGFTEHVKSFRRWLYLLESVDLATPIDKAVERTKSYQDWLLLREHKELAAAGDTTEPTRSFLRFRYFLESGELVNGYPLKTKATVKALMAELQADDGKGRGLSVDDIDSRAAKARVDALDAGLLLDKAMTAAALDSSPLRAFLRGLEPVSWFDGLWTNWTELRPVLEQLVVRLQAGLLATGEPAEPQRTTPGPESAATPTARQQAHDYRGLEAPATPAVPTTVDRAAAYITKHAGSNGCKTITVCKEACDGMEYTSFISHISPALRARGFRVTLGCAAAWYPPENPAK